MRRTNLYLLYRCIICFLAVIACISAPRSEAEEIQDVLAELEKYADDQRKAENVPGMGITYWARSPYPCLLHTGASLGMHSLVAFIPGVNIGMVVLTNKMDHNVPTNILTRFFELYFDLPPLGDSSALTLLDRKPEKTVTPLVPPPTEKAPSIRRFAGVYKNPAYENAVVRMEGSSLVLFLGPQMIEGSLTPQSGYTFKWAVSDWPEIEMDVTFVPNSSGQVRSLVIDKLNDVNGRVFVKIQQ